MGYLEDCLRNRLRYSCHRLRTHDEPAATLAYSVLLGGTQSLEQAGYDLVPLVLLLARAIFDARESWVGSLVEEQVIATSFLVKLQYETSSN